MRPVLTIVSGLILLAPSGSAQFGSFKTFGTFRKFGEDVRTSSSSSVSAVFLVVPSLTAKSFVRPLRRVEKRNLDFRGRLQPLREAAKIRC